MDKMDDLLKTALLVIGVVAVCFFCLNQVVTFLSYNRAIADPCGTCLEVNPDLDLCEKRFQVDLYSLPIINSSNINSSNQSGE